MTGPKVIQRIQVVSILLHEAKPVLRLFCLYLNTVGCSSHMTSMIRRDNWLGFKSLWLGFRIRVYGQGLGSSFRFSGLWWLLFVLVKGSLEGNPVHVLIDSGASETFQPRT